jgi:hypothetical protein
MDHNNFDLQVDIFDQMKDFFENYKLDNTDEIGVRLINFDESMFEAPPTFK